MMGQTKSTPRDVFSHLLAVVTLYISIGAFIALIFQYVDIWYPDQVYGTYYSFRAASAVIQNAMAALIVVWPVYLGMLWLLSKDVAGDPEKRELRIRKWLFNLTLFIAALAIIIDLITLINSFLSGELTARFALKVLTVLVVAGVVFGYYLWDLKRDADAKTKIPKFVAWIISIVVVVCIVGGFIFVGSPKEQRAMRMDEQRVSDLQIIQSQIINYWQNKKELPKALVDLRDDILGFIPPEDPETYSAYEYEIVDKDNFKLCATFAKPSPSIDSKALETIVSTEPFGQNWEHNAGRVCFDRKIDVKLWQKPTDLQDKYPVAPAPIAP